MLNLGRPLCNAVVQFASAFSSFMAFTPTYITSHKSSRFILRALLSFYQCARVKVCIQTTPHQKESQFSHWVIYHTSANTTLPGHFTPPGSPPPCLASRGHLEGGQGAEGLLYCGPLTVELLITLGCSPWRHLYWYFAIWWWQCTIHELLVDTLHSPERWALDLF